LYQYPVHGYATTNPNRARPYTSTEFVVNRYPQAVQKSYNKTVAYVLTLVGILGKRMQDQMTN